MHMKFGICTDLAQSALAREQGWDFIEEVVWRLLEGTAEDADWKGADRARSSVLPIRAANQLVIGSIKVTGPDANLDTLQTYMTRVIRRGAEVGMKTLVFGSGGARKVPDGFDPDKARGQVIAFLRMAAPIAHAAGATVVVEPLHRGETNIINTVAEGMSYVWAVNHPGVKCLVDSFHFWTEEEPLDNLRAAMPRIAHVHLADKVGRVAPGKAGSDYRAFFAVLKSGGYTGDLSVEAPPMDLSKEGKETLDFIRRQWREA